MQNISRHLHRQLGKGAVASVLLATHGKGTLVRNNYVHLIWAKNEEYPYWSQTSAFTARADAIAEYNVIRDGAWVVQFVEGEFRYNLISDSIDHNSCRNGSIGALHHNIFFRFKHMDKYGTAGTPAMVRTSWQEPVKDPAPARLGYADYNCFFSPESKIHDNYALSVAGKVERKDSGFGLHDLPQGGKVDAPCDPKFKGPLPIEFPFKDEDVKSGKVTVAQILKFFRDAYTPSEGSPVIGAGDPADGKDSFIGAIGPAGCAHADDRFGKLSANDAKAAAKP